MIRQLRAVPIFFALAGIVLAEGKPDFTGEWKMNPEKSAYGMVPKPDRMVRKIEHTEPKLRMTTTQTGQRGEVTTEINLVIDGTEQANKSGNTEVKSTPRWEGSTLRIDTRRPIQSGELVMQDKWSLSADGRSITIATHIIAPMGETDITVVLDKQ